MATGQTDLDKLVGTEPEDVVRKHYPSDGAHDSHQDKVEDGGSAKLPSNIKPFTVKGA